MRVLHHPFMLSLALVSACGPDAPGTHAETSASCATITCSPVATCDDATAPPVCRCPSGYTDPRGDGSVCSDIDECTNGTDDCDTHATCTNTAGGFICTCDQGYTGDGRSCALIDCVVEPSQCDENADCVVNAAAATCHCRAGYTGDGVTCIDDDECDGEGSGNDCDPRVSCTNLAGSYVCGACPTGYEDSTG